MSPDTILIVGVTGVIYLLGIAALAGQSRANSTAMKEKQDLMNQHMILLNGQTFKSHREIGMVIGAMKSLPCMKHTDLEMSCPEEKGGTGV